MSARLTFSPDAAAHSAKNAPTAPGSAVQPHDRTKEISMVDTHTAARVVEMSGEVVACTYTPYELNRMVSREIAGRLQELADTLEANAAFLRANASVPAGFARPRFRAYLDVAAQLRAVARHEVETTAARAVA